MGYFVFFLLFALSVFAFLYHFIAAISRNIQRAVHSDGPFELTALGNILWASLAMAFLLIVLILFAEGVWSL